MDSKGTVTPKPAGKSFTSEHEGISAGCYFLTLQLADCCFPCWLQLRAQDVFTQQAELTFLI